jgi:hypothetical protein
MKYIIFFSPDGPRIEVFCAPTTHREQADAHRSWTLLSAGFIEFLGEGRVRCHGRSESLNLRPDPRDEQLIEAFMRATARLSLASPIPA